MNRFARRFVLTQRQKATRKFSILLFRYTLAEGQSTVLLQFCAISHIEKSRLSILTTGYISNLKDLGFINVKQEKMTTKTSRIYCTDVKRVLR